MIHTLNEAITLVVSVLSQVAPTRLTAVASPPQDTRLAELGLDSIQRMELIDGLERRLGHLFDDAALLRISTLGDLAGLVQHMRSPRGSSI